MLWSHTHTHIIHFSLCYRSWWNESSDSLQSSIMQWHIYHLAIVIIMFMTLRSSFCIPLTFLWRLKCWQKSSVKICVVVIVVFLPASVCLVFLCYLRGSLGCLAAVRAVLRVAVSIGSIFLVSKQCGCPWDFNTHTDVDACDCTLRLCWQGKRLHWKPTVGDNPSLHQGLDASSIVPGSPVRRCPSPSRLYLAWELWPNM